MGRITSFSKQIIVFFLVTALIIRPTFAANVGGWNIGGLGVAQGASVIYEGTKQVIIDGKEYIKKGTAKITPSASAVAKVLARGAAAYALSVAVEQLLGSVDWVLDPANNSIKYKQKCTNQCIPESGTYAVIALGQNAIPTKESFSKAVNVKNYANEFAAKQSLCYGAGGYRISAPNTCIGYKQSGDYIVGTMDAFWFEVTKPQEEEKSIPLETVAAQVISNAAANDVEAQKAVVSAASDIVAEAETDNTKARPIVQQLESSAQTKPADEAAAESANTATGTQTQNPTKPETTDLALEFPAFCGWAPLVCEAAQKVISFPITLTEWWETSKTKAEEWSTSITEAWTKVKEEYADKPEENTDTQLDLPDQSDPNINTDLSFGGSCPASRSVPVSFAGIHTEIEFSFQWFCEVASIAKPVVISISAFAAALIVAGVRTEDD